MRKNGPAFYKVPGSALVAVRDYAQRHGIARYYTDAQALIDDPEVDAVYIATPPDSHYAYSLQVAAAGKHCFAPVRQWLADGRIGEVRHLHWSLSKAASEADRSGAANWRTDPQIAGGGYLADLASRGQD